MRNIFGEKLQRDSPAQFQVLRRVHYAHAAGPELLENSVVRKRLPNKLGGRAHLRNGSRSLNEGQTAAEAGRTSISNLESTADCVRCRCACNC